MEPAKAILLQILRESTDKGFSVGKTQLIKLLYLVEVEYFRTVGERLTELKWIFYFYGPYCYELESILESKEFQRDSLKTERETDFIRFRIAEPQAQYEKFVGPKISLVVKRIVGQWGNRRLADLLNFVYFETEPMQAVRGRRQQLDFRTIKREAPEPVLNITASKKAKAKVKELQARLSGHLQKLGKDNSFYLHRDDDEVEALGEWDKTSEGVELSEFTVQLPSQ